VESTVSRLSTRSVTTRLSASDTPPLVTVTVKVPLAPPASMVAELKVLLTLSWTSSLTVVLTRLLVLLAAFGSLVPELATVAAFEATIRSLESDATVILD